MPARNGKQYLQGLKDNSAEVWLEGERVRDVTSHPGLRTFTICNLTHRCPMR